MPATGSSGGPTLHSETPVILVAARSLHAASAQMLSHTVINVVGPAGIDHVSIRKCLEFNARAAQLITHLDAGAWNLASGAMAIEAVVLSTLAQEAANTAKFSGGGGAAAAANAAAGAVPTFPPAPSIPDVPVPDVPGPPEAPDAEYISTLVNGGVGAEPHENAGQHWQNIGRSLLHIAEVVRSAGNALENGWQSAEAEVAHRALKTFHHWVSEAGKAADELGKEWHVHAGSWRTVQKNIPTPQEARQTKLDLVKAMDDNEVDGGLSTPRVIYHTGVYHKHNEQATTQMAAYDTGQSSPASAGPGSGAVGPPPPITAPGAAGPPRVDGTPTPPQGPLENKLTDDPDLQSIGDPKTLMAMMMAGVTAATSGLGAVNGAGSGLLQPIQSLPGQVIQQVTSMAAKAAAPHPPAPLHKAPASLAHKAGGGKGGGGGGGVKPAGLGGGAKMAPPPAAFPAASSSPAVHGAPPPKTGPGGPGGAGAGGMMPMGAAGAGQGNRKDKARNKGLFPDQPVIDSDVDHVPAVLGADAEPEAKKPAYGHKVVKKDEPAK